MNTDLAYLRLLQLVSPGLPIGMYSYSQGLEMAVEDKLVTNADEAGQWIEGLLMCSISRLDVPIVFRIYDAWKYEDFESVIHWSTFLLASRETSELRAEDRQTGQALARLLADMDIIDAQYWIKSPDATLANLFSLAAVRWSIDKRTCLYGYLWSWLENQVLCAVKLIPLGQVAGQRLLFRLAERISKLVNIAEQLTDEQIGGSAFGLALSSSRHEMQYSRLFRS